MGKLIRRLGAPRWRDALKLAGVAQALAQDDGAAALAQLQTLAARIESEQLASTALGLKPLFTGGPLLALLNMAPGPRLTVIMDAQMEWLLEHPDRVHDADGCASFLRARFGQEPGASLSGPLTDDDQHPPAQ
jgi:hypothetical protein